MYYVRTPPQSPMPTTHSFAFSETHTLQFTSPFPISLPSPVPPPRPHHPHASCTRQHSRRLQSPGVGVSARPRPHTSPLGHGRHTGPARAETQTKANANVAVAIAHRLLLCGLQCSSPIYLSSGVLPPLLLLCRSLLDRLMLHAVPSKLALLGLGLQRDVYLVCARRAQSTEPAGLRCWRLCYGSRWGGS